MDSGCVKPGDEFEELYDVARPLLPEEVLGIIDQLICHEVCFRCLFQTSGPPRLTGTDLMASWIPAIANAIHQRICRGPVDA
jgi:hypothetical protein